MSAQDHLTSEVLSLTVPETAKLLRLLLESLKDVPEEEFDLEWQPELRKRANEVRDGKVMGIPWDQARERNMFAFNILATMNGTYRADRISSPYSFPFR